MLQHVLALSIAKNIALYGYIIFHLAINQLEFELFIFLAIINNAAMNICVQVFAWTHDFVPLR